MVLEIYYDRTLGFESLNLFLGSTVVARYCTGIACPTLTAVMTGS